MTSNHVKSHLSLIPMTTSQDSSFSQIVNPVQSSNTTLADIQVQLMHMLTESFSILSTVLVDKTDSKTDWPKFSGDQKKFQAWYLSIMTQLSIAPWKELYDSATNDIISSTSNTTLNEKLYAKIISYLEGQVLQDIAMRAHLRANGLLLLQELGEMYKPKHVPEVLAAKAGEFWSKTKWLSNESVDHYYNRFQELLEDLSHADDKISTKSAMHHFIFTLGSKFEPIQHNYHIGNLPGAWKTTSWPALLILCRDFYNSVNPTSFVSCDTKSDITPDCALHQKKIKNWFSSTQ
jgi:hypothetical protein